MKKIIYVTLVLGILCCTTACRKYVEINPEQTRILKLTSDYQSLLYNSSKIQQAYYLPIFSGDDFGTDEEVWQKSLSLIVKNVYIWAENIYGNTEDDQDWSSIYSQVFIYNTIINNVMNSEGGTTEQKNAVKAAALVHRAFAYYILVNMFGKQYDAATASADPGVPLMLEPSFTADLTRASVQTVYNQISTDLETAIPSLPDKPDFITNPSKAAAYAIMARVHLNKREFTKAAQYADLTLAIQNTLLDLNDYKVNPTTTFPARLKNPEEILIKCPIAYPASFPISKDAISMYDQANDLRYVLYLNDPKNILGSNFITGRGYFKSRFADGVFVGPSVPEVLLIKAECEARANRPGTAMELINTLRRKRYEKTNYNADLTASTGDAALHLVIDERKRELVGRGFRWFDQRRLAKDPGFINTVIRVFNGVTYTLDPGGNRYTYPIANKYIEFNPEITQNPK